MVVLVVSGMRRAALGALVAVCLSACVMGGQVRMGPVAKMLKPQPDLCGAAALIDVVGQPFTLLADHQLVGPLRILWPGQEITDEVVPNRLNAEVTNDQLILRLSCG
ncbi:I78 family peptidase inhibitor [Cypionkella sinensis]|uniref:I78 family peptidase inhibitor n=1 Tax=Cypionkella sinensis TaxID=1756043 RepID=A0ABV7J679_9RHOB